MQQDQDVNPHNTNLEYGQQSDPNFDQGQSLPYYGQQSYGGQPDYTQQSYGGFCLYGSQLQFGYGQPPYQLKNEPHYSQSSYGSEGETDFVDDSDEFVEDTYGGDDAEESGSSINTNSDGTETGDESDQDPETISYATNRAFASREDLQKWAKDRGRKYGFVIVIGRSRPNESVELLCDRGPKRPSTAKVRNTGSIKNDCAFKLVGRYNGRSDCWSLEEICKLHNHKPVVFEEGHPYLRRLTPEQSDFVGTLYKLHVRPRNILLALREKFPGSCCIIKDIYNVTRKIREQDKVGKSPMEILENYLYANGFVFSTRVNEITNATEDIFFCHPLSYKMWRACGINGRKDSTDKCNFRDVFYLRCLLTHRRCNLARCLAAYSSSYYHRQSRGSLLGGPYVTRIAHSYAYILNLHQLRIPPVPPMPCGVPTVRGMGMYAVFPGIGPRLRTRKDAPPYVPVPLVEPDPLNAPEIQIDGDQPVHEEDPPQHPAIIYRVARLPPATQALLQRLDQRSEQLSREIVEMRHMMSYPPCPIFLFFPSQNYPPATTSETAAGWRRQHLTGGRQRS
ncbi:hypothetical protein SSX86_013997 [Deinandra increscens subsp. villosa]|uniref:Uncharacterized protein n=1 Tax=Deinandra increscens subsp. villosa TaxID=3103831 RepID=A0AAP0GZF8_9ASTR